MVLIDYAHIHKIHHPIIRSDQCTTMHNIRLNQVKSFDHIACTSNIKMRSQYSADFLEQKSLKQKKDLFNLSSEVYIPCRCGCSRSILHLWWAEEHFSIRNMFYYESGELQQHIHIQFSHLSVKPEATKSSETWKPLILNVKAYMVPQCQTSEHA